ncbi:MAG: TonB-dependent receptor [Bryobacteraceae bacterium]
MTQEVPPTHQKALQVNLDKSFYRTIAEIGAGQEVAHWFFRVGAAAGTVAKAMSAYDMKFSDAIYGTARRYVTRQRLQEMLTHEYRLLMERLDATRGETSRFFAFADTVAATSFSRKEEGRGWLGIRFQTEPRGAPSDILIHTRLLDRENHQQQAALGILGVNLVFGAKELWRNPEDLIRSLDDNLSPGQVEIDMISFSGPAFGSVDNRLMILHLVQLGLSGAAMFDAKGQPVEPSEALYQRPVIVGRGSFRPVTLATAELLRGAYTLFLKEPAVEAEQVVPVIEMTMSNLTVEGAVDKQDFLDRVDSLGSIGVSMMVSNFAEYYRLAQHLFRYTKKMIGMGLGLPSLLEIFDEKYYDNLEGGILESFGRLFRNGLTLYVYPMLQDGQIVTVENMPVAPNLRHLYSHLVENGSIEGIREYTPEYLSIHPGDVLDKIRTGDLSWVDQVPPDVAALIRDRGYFRRAQARKMETT